MSKPRPRLQSLIVELTQRCNHRCQYCYNVWQGAKGKTYPRGQLDAARTIDLLAKALDETDCRHVTLTGGEPLLRPDLCRILTFLQKRHVQVTLISNGHLLDEGMTASLIQHGVGLFELPLLSHCSDTHDELTDSAGSWNAVLQTMTTIRKRHGQVVISFVATRRNIGHLSETIRLAFAFGARGFMFNRFNPGGRGRDYLEALLPTLDQVQQALELAETAGRELGLPISSSIPIQPCLVDTGRYPHLGFGYCAVGTERAYYTLDPLGNLRPCNHSDAILGNLCEKSFFDLISNNEKLNAFCKSLPSSCFDCSRRDECQGGCKASAQVCYGSPLEEEPFLRKWKSRASTPVAL